jgi:hypothetical protein
MPFTAHFTSTADFQSAGALCAGELAAITSSPADLQSAGARPYCAGTLAAITSLTADFQSAGAGTHAVIGGRTIISPPRCRDLHVDLPWLYFCFYMVSQL